MELKTFGDLAKLAGICRKQGIKQIKITKDGVEFQLGDKPTSRVRSSAAKTDSDKIQSDFNTTEDDTLFWSSAGLPDGASRN